MTVHPDAADVVAARTTKTNTKKTNDGDIAGQPAVSVEFVTGQKKKPKKTKPTKTKTKSVAT